jgi:hypothetical protein
VSKVAEEALNAGLYSASELQAMEERAAHWMTPEGIGDLEQRAEKDALVVYQIVSDLATGRKLLPGRSGANIMARAQRDYVTLAGNVLSILRAHEEGSRGKGGKA